MCGRYALGIRAAFVRQQFQQHDMPIDEGQDEDEARESYNFAPGYHGLVYRADVPDGGARAHGSASEHTDQPEDEQTKTSSPTTLDKQSSQPTKYKLQAMKWGLIPFWTKRNPEYGSMLKTINCRDDSLLENRGMWTTMKKGKRCIVIAQGFYEWLKKNGGKEKIPHYMKRKDGQLMCFAGLWDCVKYEGKSPDSGSPPRVLTREGSDQKHFTYTIITTDSNAQLKFLHDRMPVILENGSDDIFKWLDPNTTEWNKELQSLLVPFKGELECYPVMKEVGKVGNNSADFIVPVASSDNKQNIANFFANAKSPAKTKKAVDIKSEKTEQPTLKQEDDRETVDVPRSEDNAPVPVTKHSGGSKRSHDQVEDSKIKQESSSQADNPMKKKLRSATSNGTVAKSSPQKNSNQRITNFFGK